MKKVVALEARLKTCKNVITLGVKPNFNDYSDAEKRLIRGAEKIYYPTTFYADLFDAMGKKTFPSYHTYKCVQDKIKQTALFELLEIPHPRTRVFYGKRQKSKIPEQFDYPFISKIARGSALGRGVFLVRNREELDVYLRNPGPAYIQEYLPLDRDVRIVVIGKKIVHAYWRVNPDDDFRSNVAQGGRISLDPIPDRVMRFALDTALKCQWDDVGLDVGIFNDQCFMIEGNMKYGKEGFREAGIDFYSMMETMIENEEI